MIIFLLIIFCLFFIRVVPTNTVLIVDRNSHYLKTKKNGIFFFNPFTDEITTMISTNELSKTYTNIYETHDGYIFSVSLYVRYHATNLDDVLFGLKNVRRSINDVMQGCVYWSVRNLGFSDLNSNSAILSQEIVNKLLSEAQELHISIDAYKVLNIIRVESTDTSKCFKPHLSSSSSGPIKFY